MIVAIQGEAGSFSHEAAESIAGVAVELLPCRTFDALFTSVALGDAERGVVPIENSLAGSIHENYDRLRAQPLFVVGETQVRVRHCLLARPGTRMEQIRGVASHPVALAQCRRFFSERPEIEAVPAYDTAGAVRELMQGALSADAVIASEFAALRYGAAVLRRELEDDPQNYTRFLVVARERVEPVGPSKLVLTFMLPNEPGSLYRALGVLANRKLNLTKIESRPLHGRPWEYVFYADLAAKPEDEVEKGLEDFKQVTSELRILGWFPLGKTSTTPSVPSKRT